MPSTFRKKLVWLHTWVGLTLGFAMLFLAVTGGVLVMRPHFEDLVNRHLVRASVCAAPLPLDELAVRARAAHRRDKLDSIEVTNNGETSVAVKFANKDYAYVDPCDGRVLGIQNQYGGLFGTLDGLHRFRFIDNGRKIAGFMNAVVAVFVVIGGIVLWWPRTRTAIRGALSFNPRLPGIARTLSLHRFLGAWAAAFLLTMTLTALPLSFDWARNIIAWAADSAVDSRSPPKSQGDPDAKQILMEEVWARTRAEMPTVEWAALKYPRGGGVIEVEILEHGMPHQDAKSYLYLDSATGQTLKTSHYIQDTTPARKIYLYFIAIHSGLVGGIPYQLALMLACFSVPVQLYSGFSPYIRRRLRNSANTRLSLKLVAKWMEAKNIHGFEFVHPKGLMLPAFSAGSHIELHLGRGLVRHYSLCNDPRETHRYLIAVLREPTSTGGARTLHDAVKVGDIIEACAPRNNFPLAQAADRSLLIAGGIGITPIVSMAEQLSAGGAEFVLHYCVGSFRGAALLDRIERSAFGHRLRLHVGEQGDRLDIGELLRSADRQTHIYVCGPARMIDEVMTTAQELGWPDSRVHREYFVAETYDTANDTAFDVKIVSSGLTVHVPKDSSVAAGLALHGIDIPTSCSEGLCGSCMTRVLAGEVEHRDRVLTPVERACNDRFTPCCSRSAGPILVLDL
jgi:vanillate O-demethylase ferredoxin subunit